MRRFRTWSLADAEEIEALRARDPRPATTRLLTAIAAPIALTMPLLACNPKGIGDTSVVTCETVNTDQDRDGLLAEEEAALGTSTSDPDSDNDGLNDGAERTLGTNPTLADSDAGGTLDSVEARIDATDPLVAGDDVPDTTDTDGDGVTDRLEQALASNPALPDTDADGVTDGDELLLSTDPRSADSDGDTVPDAEEVAAGTNPADACSGNPDFP